MDISFRVRVWGPFHRRASIGRASRRLPSYFHQNQHIFKQKCNEKNQFRTINGEYLEKEI